MSKQWNGTGGFAKDVLLDFILIPAATSPLLKSCFAYLYVYFCFSFLFLIPLFFLQLLEGQWKWSYLGYAPFGKEMATKKGCHQHRSIATMWSSAPLEVWGGLLAQKKKKDVPTCNLTVLMLISSLLGYFVPRKILHSWKKVNSMTSLLKTTKMLSPSFLINIF